MVGDERTILTIKVPLDDELAERVEFVREGANAPDMIEAINWLLHGLLYEEPRPHLRLAFKDGEAVAEALFAGGAA